MYKNKDFQIPNIANAPIEENKVRRIFDIFGEAYLKYQNLDLYNCCKNLSVSENTFRKTVNHACIIGILDNDNGMYHLSELSLKYFYEKISYKEYIDEILLNNNQLHTIQSIISLLLSFFGRKMKKKTISNIFCVISTNRMDHSAINSVSRNLAPIYNMLRVGEYIDLRKEYIFLCGEEKVQDLFADKQILTVKQISKSLRLYFDSIVVEKILSVVSTYEYETYIWAKSSLFKNQGEVCNLNGEYIMSVMKKEEEDDR